jgi:uncharacterized protein
VTTRRESVERYWAAAAAGQLQYEWCTACKLAIFPPRALCPYCWSAGTVTERTSQGTGTVYSYAGQSDQVSHQDVVFLLVELDEGFFVFSQAAEGWRDVRIGARVAVGFAPLADGRTGPVFRPAGGTGPGPSGTPGGQP